MAYTLTSAATFVDLLDEIELFAEANGWTVDWNTGSQIGLRSGSCFAAWGVDGTTNPVVVTDTYPTPDVNYNDFRFYGALGKDFVGHASHYWGLTSSPVTTAADAERISCNDVQAPLSEVHLFGNADYIWVLIRSTEDRYTHFGFGILDKKGQTTPDVSFASGTYWNWWENATSSGLEAKRNLNYHGGVGNRLFYDKSSENTHFYLADGSLDPAFGVADDAVFISDTIALLVSHAALEGGVYPVDSGGAIAPILGHFGLFGNKPITGGIPLLSLPVLIGTTATDSLLTFLGDFPGVRLCMIDNLAIGEEITYGSETWMVFPIKRRTGLAYDGGASTYGLGVAFKKEV